MSEEEAIMNDSKQSFNETTSTTRDSADVSASNLNEQQQNQTESTTTSNDSTRVNEKKQSETSIVGVETAGITSRKVRQPCRYFFECGKCLRGDNCPYSHGPAQPLRSVFYMSMTPQQQQEQQQQSEDELEDPSWEYEETTTSSNPYFIQQQRGQLLFQPTMQPFPIFPFRFPFFPTPSFFPLMPFPQQFFPNLASFQPPSSPSVTQQQQQQGLVTATNEERKEGQQSDENSIVQQNQAQFPIQTQEDQEQLEQLFHFPQFQAPTTAPFSSTPSMTTSAKQLVTTSGSEVEEANEEETSPALVPVQIVFSGLEMGMPMNSTGGVSGGIIPWVPKYLRYRTKMCSFFYYTGRCRKGNHCNFSHQMSAEMQIPPLPPEPQIAPSGKIQSARPCRFFFEKGTCVKGDECNYSHTLPSPRHQTQ